MKRILFLFLLNISFYGSSQYALDCPTISSGDQNDPKAGDCTQQSNESIDYFRRYEYFKDIYGDRNGVLIPIDIVVWQKEDGSGNYIDNNINRERLDTIIQNLNLFYKKNIGKFKGLTLKIATLLITLLLINH